MKKITLIVLALSGLYACQTDPKENQEKQGDTAIVSFEPTSPVKNHELMDSLIKRAILYGDDKAYNNVSNDYLIEDMGEDILYVSMIVADKYNNPEAHYHIYSILNDLGNSQYVDSLGKKTKDFTLYHLLKAHELGYENAKYKIHEIFGKDKEIPKSTYYLNEYMQESNK